jgi:hypothetical protein
MAGCALFGVLTVMNYVNNKSSRLRRRAKARGRMGEGAMPSLLLCVYIVLCGWLTLAALFYCETTARALLALARRGTLAERARGIKTKIENADEIEEDQSACNWGGFCCCFRSLCIFAS